MPLKPICFMVMPFGIKDTQQTNSAAPARLNFDRLWTDLFIPVVRDLGYEPVRADADLGASIIRDMIERLTLSDLVIADLTVANANVFYEVGIRHAARPNGCVLVAASWSRQPFDTQSMRHEHYTIAGEIITAEEVADNRARLVARIDALATAKTPCFELEGFPNLPLTRAQAFREWLMEMNTLNSRITALREAPESDARTTGVEALLAECKQTGQQSMLIAFELLKLVRDTRGFERTLEFIEQLPQALRDLPFFVEQRALAIAKARDPLSAIGPLQTLIEREGATPEREGLLGGRYKQLWRTERNQDRNRAARYLAKAIEHYDLGRELDLNEYYAASNLPLLLKTRGAPGDVERGARIATCVVAACERAIARRSADEYVYPTLLVAAFHAGDVAKAQELAERVRQSPSDWKLSAALADLNDAARLTEPSIRVELERILAKLTPAAGPQAAP